MRPYKRVLSFVCEEWLNYTVKRKTASCSRLRHLHKQKACGHNKPQRSAGRRVFPSLLPTEYRDDTVTERTDLYIHLELQTRTDLHFHFRVPSFTLTDRHVHGPTFHLLVMVNWRRLLMLSELQLPAVFSWPHFSTKPGVSPFPILCSLSLFLMLPFSCTRLQTFHLLEFYVSSINILRTFGLFYSQWNLNEILFGLNCLLHYNY